MIKITLIGFIFFCFFNSKAQKFVPEAKAKKSTSSTFPAKEIPPGIIKLPNGSMIDETEITNFNWCEYLYWIWSKIGKNSQEYKAALPDSNVWIQVDTILNAYVEYYLRHPAYRDYPVVGITQQQALDFCNWRTNRVYEYILIREGVLKWEPDQTKETYFTIERYFAGNYKGYVPDTNFNYVPRYSLSKIEEWKYAVNYADSVERKGLIKSRNKLDKYCSHNGLIIQTDVPLDGFGSSGDVVVSVASKCGTRSIDGYVYHLRGNVAEWVIEKDTCIGGGWNDSRKMIFSQPVVHQTKQSLTQVSDVYVCG